MRGIWILAGLVPACVACQDLEKTPPPAHASAAQVALSGAAIFIGVGDIGVCGTQGDEATAALVDSVIKADSAARVESVVFTVGDNAYPAGSDRDFARCFASWGDPKKRIMKLIRPAIGNHDYRTGRGGPYYRYFGARAGPRYKGYYSYDIGEWHAVVLNSEIVALGSRAEQVAQEEWLEKDLQEHSNQCTLAYYHRPFYSSGEHGPSAMMLSIWEILSNGGVDLVINGHEHHYERFRPMNAAGVLDTLKGMEQIIVGTGGGDLRAVRDRLSPNSAVQIQGHFGVLIAALGRGEYRTSFLDTEGRVWDASGRKCH
jgi:hypothetical protein